MSYRIGIFDPAFRAEGHFIAFDRYMKDILSAPDTEITFIDQDGQMRAAYGEGAGTNAYAYLDLPSRPHPLPWLPGRLGRVFARLSFWKRALRTIEKHGFDLVIFTADPRDIAMCLFPLRFPYGAVIMYPYVFVPNVPRKGLGARIQSFLYTRFLSQAALRFSTNEPPILSAISDLLNLRDIHWIPDVPAEERTAPKTPISGSKFLTIGTISKSKNHRFVLDAFRDAKIPYAYRIAGKPLDETGHAVAAQTEELSKDPDLAISGDFGYLDETRYMDLMQSAEFLIFPYDFTRGDISSQVLHDAFSTGTPFIAPDIEPFRWYVERYGIGLLYPEGDTNGLIDAVRSAHESGRTAFLPGFEALRKAHALPVIRESFQAAIRPLLERVRTSQGARVSE